MISLSDALALNYSLDDIIKILLEKNIIQKANNSYAFSNSSQGYHYDISTLINVIGIVPLEPEREQDALEWAQNVFWSAHIPNLSTLRNFTNANVFSKHLLERDFFDINIKRTRDDESHAPAYVNMESGVITFESELIYDMIKQRYLLFCLGTFVHYQIVLGHGDYYTLSEEIFSKSVLYIFSFLFYHEISHLIYSPFTSQSFKDLLVRTVDKYSDKGLTEQHVHRMSNYISDMYDENKFRFAFGTMYFGLINSVYDTARYFTRPPQEVDINSFEDALEGIQYHTLMQIFTAAPENYTQMTKDVSHCLSIDNVIDRQSLYFDIVMKHFKEEQVSTPSVSPEIVYCSGDSGAGKVKDSSSSEEPNNLPPFDPENKAEDIAKVLVQSPPSFITSMDSVMDYRDLPLPIVITEFYDTLTSGFTDEWRDYLTKQDAQVDGYLSGKFDYKHAYKTQLTPRVFTKQLGHRRESDLRVKIAIDFSGSMFNDLVRSSKSKQKLVKFDASDFNSNDFDDYDGVLRRSERIVASSATYCSAIALALSSVFKRAENIVDIAYFSSSFVALEPFDYDKSNLGRLIDFSMNGRFSGGGTNLFPLLESFVSSFDYVLNKDKLIVIITDGAFGGSSDILSLIKQGEEAGIFFMFVGIGIYMRDEFITSNSSMLSYTNGNDMAVRFPADFADFINKKYFTEV